MVSDLHQGLDMNVRSGRGWHQCITCLYADMNIHKAFVSEAGRNSSVYTLRACTPKVLSLGVERQILQAIPRGAHETRSV